MVEQGGGRRKRRAYNTKITHIVPSIHSLPHELPFHVLGRVASHSLRDLLNAKLSCREWNELGDDNLVYKHASLAKISIFRWKRETPENKRRRSLFLQKCVDAGNLEALYRRGVVDYLQNKERGYALGCLKKAANAGHVASMYAVCIISIYLGEHKKDGISVLGRMKKSKQSRKEVRQARWKLLDIIKMMWLRNFMGVAPKPVCCTKHRLCKKNGWGPIDSDDEDSGIECESYEAPQTTKESLLNCDLWPSSFSKRTLTAPKLTGIPMKICKGNSHLCSFVEGIWPKVFTEEAEPVRMAKLWGDGREWDDRGVDGGLMIGEKGEGKGSGDRIVPMGRVRSRLLAQN
nr:putative F-box protein At1g67623 [Ipomoea batatas]